MGIIAILLYPFALILNLVSKSFLLAIADGVGWFVFNIIRFRRDIVLSNLTLAFGQEKSSEEIEKLALKNYQHYAAVLFEILMSVSWNKETYRRKITIHNWEAVEPFVREKKGGFILTSHLGNWEYSIGGAVSHGLPADVIVKESRTKAVEKFLQWYRRKSGAGIFLETKTTREIIRSIGSGRFVAFILDQFMGPPIGLPVNFFGKKAGTAVALALMSEKWEVPVVGAYNYRDGKGNLHTVFKPALDFSKLSSDKNERLFQKTQMFNDMMEEDIRKHPEQWLWLHRRWKEYKGEPRWELKRSLAPALVLIGLLLNGCATTGATPTGIALPTDPTIAVPSFDETKADPDTVDEEKTRKELKMPENDPLRDVIVAKDKNAKKQIQKEKPKGSTKKPTDSFVVVPMDKIPFELGERLEMQLGWTALPAGRAVLEVRSLEKFNGRDTFHLWGNILSSKIVDAIYHVDNTIESWVDARGLIPYKFLLHMVESKQLKETRVSFDHPNKKAYYWAKRISERWGNQDIDRADEFTPYGRDMFTALYYARALSYTLNQKQTFSCYENGQNWQVELTPIAKELVTGPVGAMQCWKIKVNATLKNTVLSPAGDLFLWLSDDSKKYPVKFEAKIKIGFLYGLLQSIKEH